MHSGSGGHGTRDMHMEEPVVGFCSERWRVLGMMMYDGRMG